MRSILQREGSGFMVVDMGILWTAQVSSWHFFGNWHYINWSGCDVAGNSAPALTSGALLSVSESRQRP